MELLSSAVFDTLAQSKGYQKPQAIYWWVSARKTPFANALELCLSCTKPIDVITNYIYYY